MRPTEQQTLTCVHGRGTALGSLGLVERCYRPSSRVVRAYDTNVPQQWNERRWSSGTKKHTRNHPHTQNVLSYLEVEFRRVRIERKLCIRQGEMCILSLGEALREEEERVTSIFFLDHSLFFSRKTRVRMPNGFQAH